MKNLLLIALGLFLFAAKTTFADDAWAVSCVSKNTPNKLYFLFLPHNGDLTTILVDTEVKNIFPTIEPDLTRAIFSPAEQHCSISGTKITCDTNHGMTLLKGDEDISPQSPIVQVKFLLEKLSDTSEFRYRIDAIDQAAKTHATQGKYLKDECDF